MSADPTNQNRADHAEQTVQYHSHISGNTEESEDEAVIDLLTNLRHFCASAELDFDQASRIAEMHYEAESEEGDK